MDDGVLLPAMKALRGGPFLILLGDGISIRIDDGRPSVQIAECGAGGVSDCPSRRMAPRFGGC